MSELRGVRIEADGQGKAHVYVIGTDIELLVSSCTIVLDPNECPVAHLEIYYPEVEVKSRWTKEQEQ